MTALRDCRYSVFVSYAHADDKFWGGWVSQFSAQLLLSLNNSPKLRGRRPPPLHLSGDNGPVAGRLGDELRERVASSFAMVIVVHDNYAQSEWCLRELAYFRQVCGDDSWRDRLYVVALSADAVESVSHSAAWQKLLPGADQLWMPFFQASRPQQPVEVFLAEGVLHRDFREPFERLRDDLVEKIRLDPGPGPRPPPPPPPLQPPQVELLFGIGAETVQPRLQAVATRLVARGVPFAELGPDALGRNFAQFARARQLVLPFDEQPPGLANALDGGVLALQRNAWLAQGHSAHDLLWLDLRRDPAAAPEGAAKYVAALGVPVLSDQQLLALLEPPPPPPPPAPPPPLGVRIFIESNARPGEHDLWLSLGDQIRRRWYSLFAQAVGAEVPPLILQTVGLPVDELDEVTGLDTADGVVLLWGRKDSRSLQAQIDRVLRKLPPSREAVPGLVAYLMPPHVSEGRVPAWIWQVLRFDFDDEGSIDVIDEEEDDLQRFLKRVLRRRLARDAESAAVVPAAAAALALSAAARALPPTARGPAP